MYYLKIDDDIADRIIRDTLTQDYRSMLESITGLIVKDYSKLHAFEKEDFQHWCGHMHAFRNILNYYLMYSEYKKLMEDTEEQYLAIEKYIEAIPKE